MKKTILGLTAASILLLATLRPVAATPLVEYQVIDLPDTTAGDIWQYRYQVSQFDFSATNLRRDNPTLGALASSPASGHRRQSTAGKMPALSGNSLYWSAR